MTETKNQGRKIVRRAPMSKGDRRTQASASRFLGLWNNATALDVRELEGFTRTARDVAGEESFF